MYAYKEIITVDNLQQLTLSKPLPFPLGKKVEVLIISEDDDENLEEVRQYINQQGLTENAIQEAVDWARQ